MLPSPSASIRSSTLITPSRNGSAPIKSAFGLRWACQTRCSPPPKPISSQTSRAPGSNGVAKSSVTRGSSSPQSCSWRTLSLRPCRRPKERSSGLTACSTGFGVSESCAILPCKYFQVLRSLKVEHHGHATRHGKSRARRENVVGNWRSPFGLAQRHLALRQAHRGRKYAASVGTRSPPHVHARKRPRALRDAGLFLAWPADQARRKRLSEADHLLVLQSGGPNGRASAPRLGGQLTALAIAGARSVFSQENPPSLSGARPKWP